MNLKSNTIECLNFLLKYYKGCEYITKSSLESLCKGEKVDFQNIISSLEQLTQVHGLFEVKYIAIYDNDEEEELYEENINDAEKNGILITPSGFEIKSNWKQYVHQYWTATDKMKKMIENNIKKDDVEKCSCGEPFDPENYAVLGGIKYCFDCFDAEI